MDCDDEDDDGDIDEPESEDDGEPDLSPPQDCWYNRCNPKTHYCSEDGACIFKGLCTRDEDCFNTFNDPFKVAMCVGSITCIEGTCEMECDEGDDDRATAINEIG